MIWTWTALVSWLHTLSIHTSTQGRPPLSKCIPLLYSLLSSCQRASLVLNAPRISSWNRSMAKYVPSHSFLWFYNELIFQSIPSVFVWTVQSRLYVKPIRFFLKPWRLGLTLTSPLRPSPVQNVLLRWAPTGPPVMWIYVDNLLLVRWLTIIPSQSVPATPQLITQSNANNYYWTRMVLWVVIRRTDGDLFFVYT